MSTDNEAEVKLCIYDLTNGLARALSPMLLGQQIEGVWHTSVVVHGTEWFFGYGVQRATPGTTPFGQPLRTMALGSTQVPQDLVADLVSDLGRTKFRPIDYNLLHNNCNHFSNELAGVLCGASIPSDILNQHEVLLNGPLGPMLQPIIMQMEGQLGAATADGFAGTQTAAQGGAPATSAGPGSASQQGGSGSGAQAGQGGAGEGAPASQGR